MHGSELITKCQKVFFSNRTEWCSFHKIPDFSCSCCVKRVFYSAFVWKCTGMCKHHLECSCCKIHRYVAAPTVHGSIKHTGIILQYLYRGRYFLSRNKRALLYGLDKHKPMNRLKVKTSVFFYSKSFMMRATRLLGSTMAFRETPFITLSLVNVRILGALKTKQNLTNFSHSLYNYIGIIWTIYDVFFSKKNQSVEIIQTRCIKNINNLPKKGYFSPR